MIPVAKGKDRARNLDPALRTWLRNQGTRKRFRHHGAQLLILAPTTVHDIDEEGLSFYFGTISQYGWTLDVAFDTSRLGGCLLVERTWTSSVFHSYGFML